MLSVEVVGGKKCWYFNCEMSCLERFGVYLATLVLFLQMVCSTAHLSQVTTEASLKTQIFRAMDQLCGLC